MKVSPAAVALAVGAAIFGVTAAYTWIRRGTSGWAALVLMLLAGLLYSLTYALELSSRSPEARRFWGDVKYLGVGLLPIAWVAFTLQYTGRSRLLTPRLFTALGIEPLVMLALLANGSTHDLIHVYPPAAIADPFPVIAFGMVGWANVAYTYALLLATTGLFVVTLARTAEPYRRTARLLMAALTVPWILNILYLFDVEPFGGVDLTTFGFVVAAGVLVWGIFRMRLLRIAPNARRTALDTLRDGVVVVDAYRRIVEINAAAGRTFGITAARAVGRPVIEVFPPLGNLLRSQTGAAEMHGEVSVTQPGDRRRDFDVSILPLPDKDGHSTGELIALRDVSERQQALERLREAEGKYRALVEQVPAVVYIDLPQQDGEQTLYVSPQIEPMLGLSPSAYLADLDLWKKHVHPEDRDRVLQEFRDGLNQAEPFSSEYRMIRPDGRLVWVRDDMIVLDQGPDRPRLVQGIMFDVTELKQAQEEAAFLAFHDALTGLPNRTMFEETLELALARARRTDAAVAVLYLDLDNFKLVNDSLGHAAGDEVLRQMIGRLRAAVRETDFLGRHGGDEFLVLLADLEAEPLTDPGSASDVAETVSRRIHHELERPFVVMGNELYLSASIGASLYPDHGTDVQTLLRAADSAMYRSKKIAPGAHAMFSPAADDAGDKLARVNALRRAVEEDNWVLHYQPIVDLRAGRVAGAEALLRWPQPDGTLVKPGEFIPVAEELGFIGRIGDWVLQELCRQARAWRDSGLPELSISFNVSLRQLWQPGFAEYVGRHLDSYDIPASSLVAEITESTAMTDPDRTYRVVRDLKELGIRVAIDDFGTGYSSLSRLTSLPVDILKLDRPFIAGVPGDPQARKMVNAVIQLALSLGMEPLAEGVETEDQRRFLAEKGCSLAQGFLWSPAVTPEELVRWMGVRTEAIVPAR